jgi:hypothetical protein
MESTTAPEATAAELEATKPERQKKEKRMVTILRYPDGPYVRQHPKNVKKAFKELARAVQSSEEYAAAVFAELTAPMIVAGIQQETAATAANLIMVRMFQHDMRETRIYKKTAEAAPRV